MKFTVIVALMAFVAARHDDEDVDVEEQFKALVEGHKPLAKKAEVGDEESSSEEPAAKYTPRKVASAKSRVKDPLIKARFHYAKDKCKAVKESKKKDCFKRNWKLYKPHQKNTIHDFRARVQRACYPMRKSMTKLNDCYTSYIKEYKDELNRLILAHDHDNNGEALVQVKRKHHGNPKVAAKANNRELSTESSVSSDDSTSSSAASDAELRGRHHAKLKR